jgi:two-component system, cell cycle sensor histidine kinase and response regulator CckA
MKNAQKRTDRLAALRIVTIYAMVAALWIYLSDTALDLLTHDPAVLYRIAVFKGLLFIVVTASILYLLISRYINKSRQAQEQLLKSQNLLNSLIEGTTDSIFVKDSEGRYLVFNEAAEKVVGKPAAEVIGKDDTFLFSAGDAAAIMAGDRRVMDAGVVMTYEDYLTSTDGSRRTFLSTKGPIFDAGGNVSVLFGIARDITEIDRARKTREATIELLRICNSAVDLKDLMHNLLIYFQQVTGCEAAGVRLKEGEDFPYYETRGFPADFVMLENSLCAYDQQGEMIRNDTGHPLYDCMCGNILCGRFDPSKPFFTSRGSFWTNSTTDLLANTTDEDRQTKTRNRCNGEGFESVALIPLRVRDEVFGLFQFNDSVRNRFTADKIAFLEDLVDYVAIAMAKMRSDDDLVEACQFSLQVINSVDEGVVVLDRGLRYQVWNPYMEQLSGVAAAEVMGKHLLEAFPFFKELGMLERAAATLRDQKPGPVDLPLPFRNGRSGWITERNTPLRNTKDDIIGVIVTIQDISDHKYAEEKLREATHRLRLAIDSGRFGIWDRDIVNDTLIWDDRMFEIYGMDRNSFTGRFEAWQKCILPDDLGAALETSRAAIRGERDYDTEFRIMLPDGTMKSIKANGIVIRDADGTAVRMIGLNQDITDHKVIEGQLRQSQKMEAIGQLAGGVAHDFNNILTVIYGYCYMLQSGTENNPVLRSNVDQVLAAAERAANLTRSLLAFSRKQPMSLKPVNVNDLILNVGKLLTRIIGEDIQLKTLFQANPLTVYADGGQIEQVMMNLATNARDAMPKGGRLTIETGIEEIREDFIHAHGYGTPGSYVVTSVSDTGEGMDAETAKKIFEPFFTTKEVGKGTGLGLSIVYGVIKQHNGFINACSEPGRGTTFRIYLPLDTEVHAEDSRKAENEYPRMGTETVLVAEDEASIRYVADSILKKFGYGVIFAHDGADAVEKFMANSEKIDIVVMDMIMPVKSGKEASEEIRRLRPDTKVLFMSGYSPDLLQSKGILKNGDEILIKPLQPLDLVRKIRSMLDRDGYSTAGATSSGS